MNDTKSDTSETACNATPSTDLRQQIMDCRVPKNEREWWASREIEKLERERNEARKELAHQTDMGDQANVMVGVYKTELDLTRARVAELEKDNERLLVALVEIRDADYKGNPHPSSTIARQAIDAGMKGQQ